MIDDQELVHRLLDAGVADKSTLRKGVELQKETGDSLYETLILKRLVSQRATVRLLGKLLAVPTIKLDQINPSSKISGLLPSSMAKRNRSIPLGLREKNDKRQLLVAMFDPTDVLAVGEISTHTGFDVRPVLVGPRDLREALEQIYGVSDSSMDDIFGELGSIEFNDDVAPPDKEWAEFFDKRDDVGAESSDISLEMRDRPSTDVLDIPEEEVEALLEEGEDPLEAFEIAETGRHQAVAMADLEKYQVDDAITGSISADTGNHSDSGSYAQILSAGDAEALFSDVPDVPDVPDVSDVSDAAESSGAEDTALDDHVGGSGPYEAASLAEESDDETNKTSGTSVGVGLRQMSELSEDSEVAEETSRTEIGHGMGGELYDEDDAVESPDDETNELDSDDSENTGQTQFGMSPSDGADKGAGAALQGGASRSKQKRNTDYRALGAAILKEESEAEDGAQDETQPREADTDALADAKTGVRDRTSSEPGKPPQDPVTREIEEDDLRELTTDKTNVRKKDSKRAPNPFAREEPTAVHSRARARLDDSFALPDDVETRDLIEAMIQSMIALGLTDGHSIVKKARKIAADRNTNEND